MEGGEVQISQRRVSSVTDWVGW